ncbi:MAG TPA: hypothetical protein VF612_14450 [Jatrophihabitans sp.]|uniref:hypothetical protein n=1 Tax=Jatrophihabitans sp. TaxID=1932789 RepID=UPI002EF80677
MVSEPVRAVAAQKLAKAKEFMLVAEAAVDAMDAAVSLAASAAINAADVILLVDVGSYFRDSDHQQAVTRLRRNRPQSARQLASVLALKPKAQYDSKRCTRNDVATALKQSGRLIDLADELLKKESGTA